MTKPAIEPELSRDRVAYHESRSEWPVAGAAALLARRVASTPDRLFVVDGSRRVTFAEFDGLAAKLARGLRGLGLEPGDVVSWQLPSWLEGAALTVALDAIGCMSNPILPIYRASEVSFILRQARSRALVVPGVFRGFDHRELAREVKPAAPDLEHVIVTRADPLAGMEAFERLLDPAETAALPQSPFGPHDASSLFYTSGTTAEPKGVLHTQSSLGAYARINAAAVGSRETDVSLLQFPLTHIGGIGAFVLLPILVGSACVYLDVWDPETAIALIEREKVTTAGGPPAILQGILAAPGFRPERFASVRNAATGAADVPPELIRRVRRLMGASSYRSYGMTECPMFSSGRPSDPEEKGVETDGRPVPGCRCRIVDDDGHDLPADREGEVLVFGPQLCVGYLDSRLDAEAFTPQGFFRSGDLGIVDDDGYLTITGRKKDIIIRKGENLSAKAIEDALHDHPKVAAAAVIGVPDPIRGELVCACVVLAPGAGELSLAEIEAFMKAKGVMAQKIPERLEILSELPRNPTGKVKKFELRDRFR
ncbi:MAG: AMP-binding protein [Candidatus Binatia bacterium]